MRFLVSLFLVGICAWGTTGCEKHRRLEALKKQREAAWSERMNELIREERYRQQQRAYDDVRESIYGYDDQVSLHGHDNHEMTEIISPYSSLPKGSKFCAGSEYYCEIDAECVPNSDGSYRCRHVTSYTPRDPSRVASLTGHTTTRHSLNQVGRPQYGNTLRKITTRRYYPLQVPQSTRYTSGSRRVQVPQSGSYTSGGRRYYPTYPRYTGTPSRTVYTSYGGSTYTCPSGFEKVNITNTRFRCDDIDECETEENECEHNCINYSGSFTCSCQRGYLKEERFKCVDRDECAEVPGICALVCQNTNGSYECPCPSGYERFDEKDCRDIDECDDQPCPSDQTCFNEIGSYKCEDPPTCPDGYGRNDADGVNGNCNLKNVTLASATIPNSIMYRKILVEATKKLFYHEAIGVFQFSSRDNFDHSYRVSVLDGGENFRYTRQHGSYYSYAPLVIKIYPKILLEANRPYLYSLMITDTPRRKPGYGYQNYRLLPTRRRMELTYYPMKYPRRRVQ